MAKAIRKKEFKRRPSKDFFLPLAKENYIIIGVGLLVIIAGYVAMLQDSVEGAMPLNVAPVLLVLGYCVIIPVGILFRRSILKKEPPAPEETPAKTA